MMTRGSNRRDLLKAAAAAAAAGAAAAWLSGCAAAGAPAYPRPYSRQPWVAPRVSMDGILRVVVGHRPYRPSGFVVRSERLDDALLVHNYGHGGAGITLSWGSSALAVREVAGRAPGAAAVIGSGVIGLTTARLLQDAGWSVIIYSADPFHHTVSNVAGGEWGPYSVHDPAVSTAAFKAQLDRAARIAHHAFTSLGPAHGVRWMELYRLSPDPFRRAGPFDDLYPYTADLAAGSHPFPSAYVRASLTMMIEPGTFLRQLTVDFQRAGGRVVARRLADRGEVLSLPERVVFNCTGLGAAALFGDDELVPAKGQLVFLPPDPAVDYLTIGGGSDSLYMFSRSDVLLLGGTFELGDWSLHPDPQQTERIVREHQQLFAGFG
jgi:D-amino-acid oxidase